MYFILPTKTLYMRLYPLHDLERSSIYIFHTSLFLFISKPDKFIRWRNPLDVFGNIGDWSTLEGVSRASFSVPAHVRRNEIFLELNYDFHSTELSRQKRYSSVLTFWSHVVPESNTLFQKTKYIFILLHILEVTCSITLGYSIYSLNDLPQCGWKLVYFSVHKCNKSVLKPYAVLNAVLDAFSVSDSWIVGVVC